MIFFIAMLYLKYSEEKNPKTKYNPLKQYSAKFLSRDSFIVQTSLRKPDL